MEIEFLEETVNSKAGAGENNEVNLEHLTVTEGKEMLKV